MALPTLAKTWEISSNNVVTASADYLTSQRQLWLNFITFLKSKGWTVRAASNSTTASTSTDLTTLADFNWGGMTGALSGYYARSWIILRNTNLGSTFDMRLDFCCNNYNDSSKNNSNSIGSFFCFIAPSGYNLSGTLTTTTNLSTLATDEINVTSNSFAASGPFFGNNFVNPSYVYHNWCSTDREVMRYAWYYNDTLVGYFSAEKVSNPVSGWSLPVVITFRTANGGSIGGTGFYSNANNLAGSGYAVAKINNTSAGVFLSGEGYTSGLLSSALGIPNDVSGEYPMIPIGVVSTTPPVRGRHGGLYDIWYSGGLINGSTFPDSSGNVRKFVFNNGLVLPWDGSVPVIR